MVKRSPSQVDLPLFDAIHEYIEFCPKQKDFVWKKTRHYSQSKGQLVGTLAENGYVYVQFFGKKYLLHRLVWFMYNGTWPKNCIDHIDGDRENNCIENLRELTQAENNAHRRANFCNANGHRGVTFVQKNKTNPWQVRIVHKNYVVLQEKFSSYELAVEAAQKVYESLGLRYD